LQQLELLGLDEKQQTEGNQAFNAVEDAAGVPRQYGRLGAYFHGMSVIKRV
jgi:hypothetical protein